MPAPLSEARALFEKMGYTVVHTWYESHGDGGLVVMQRPGCCAPDVMVLAYDRRNEVARIFPEDRGRDYLLAKEILEDPDSGWEPVSRGKVSPCCTAEFRDYHYGNFKYVRIVQVAGHGAYAVKIGADEAGKASWY
jgi:hypothetical protein